MITPTGPVGARSYSQNPGGAPQSVVFFSARDGHKNNQIYVMDPDGSNQMRVTYDAASDVDPDISRNGHSILFTSNQPGNNDIFVLDTSGELTNLTHDAGNDGWARWSPNGKEIIFESNRTGGVFEIYLMTPNPNDTPKALTDLPVMSRYPSWSPNGKQIVFRHGIDIYVMNADGSGEQTPLTQENAPSFAQMPVFSPDGHYIAFMSFREGYCSVFRMNSDGTEQKNLTPIENGVTPANWCSRAPSWSADGQQILFMSMRSGQNEIYAMNNDGSEVQQLTFDGTSGSPRGR
jgi:Tol biopolymer transport system component